MVRTHLGCARRFRVSVHAIAERTCSRAFCVLSNAEAMYLCASRNNQSASVIRASVCHSRASAPKLGQTLNPKSDMGGWGALKTLHECSYLSVCLITLHYITLHYITLHYITYIHTYIHTYMHAWMHTYIHICIYVYTKMCAYIYIYIHMYVCMCIYIYRHTFFYVCTRVLLLATIIAILKCPTRRIAPRHSRGRQARHRGLRRRRLQSSAASPRLMSKGS